MATRTTQVNEYDADGKVTGTKTVSFEVTLSQDNLDTIRNMVTAAMGSNRNYLSLGSPTAAQNTAQIKLLTRQMQAVLRVLFDQLEEATD